MESNNFSPDGRPSSAPSGVSTGNASSTSGLTPEEMSARAREDVVSKKNDRLRVPALFGGALFLVAVSVLAVFVARHIQQPTPIVVPRDLIELLSTASPDEGVALSTPSTHQNQALTWLAGNANLDSFSEEKKIQRYVLATIYYSMDGDEWKHNDGWLSDDDECSGWFNGAYRAACAGAGKIVSIDLDGNHLDGTLPEEIGLLSASLQFLSLRRNQITGTIPSTLGQLTKLVNLDIGWNFLTGTILSEIGLLTELVDISLTQNIFTSSITSEIGCLSNLISLDLSFNQFSGSIPTKIAQLSDLHTLDLSFNDLTGTIARLPNLREAYLQHNDLSTSIPSWIANWTYIEELWLSDNKLISTIPTEIGSLKTLNGLSVSRNDVTGTIPSEIGRLLLLEHLYLDGNDLTGIVPTELDYLTNLKEVWLSENQFTGNVPSVLTGEIKSAANSSSCISLAGDTMIENGSKNYASSLSTAAEAFSRIKVLLGKCPHVLANLEGPVTSLEIENDPRENPNPSYSFNMNPSVPLLLRNMGITSVGRGNNHLRDRGEQGIEDTSRHLQEAGLTHFGFGKTKKEAAMPLIFETEYGKVGITGFCSDEYNNVEVAGGDSSGILPVTEEHASLAADLLTEQGVKLRIASVHWGENYVKEVSDTTREQASILAQHGYDLVIGNGGSHNVQEFDLVDGVPVLFDIGNWIFQTKGRFKTKQALPFGAFVNVHFGENAQLLFLELRCMFVDNRLVNFKPRVCTARQAETLFSSLGEHVEYTTGDTFAKVDLEKLTSNVLDEDHDADHIGGDRYLRSTGD